MVAFTGQCNYIPHVEHLQTFLMWTTMGVHLVVVHLLFSRGLVRQYPWFAILVLYLAATSLINTAVMYWFGYLSKTYYFSSYGFQALRPAVRAVALWGIISRFPVRDLVRRSDCYFCLALAGILCIPLYSAVGFFEHAQWFPIYFALIAPLELVFFVFIARLALRARQQFVIGKNVAGILTGIGLLILAQTIRIERAFTVQASSLFIFLGQFSSFLAFAVWAMDLWNPDPPRQRVTIPTDGSE